MSGYKTEYGSSIKSHHTTDVKGRGAMVKLTKRSNRLPGIGVSFHGSGNILTPFPVEEATMITLHHDDGFDDRAIIVKDVLRKPDGTFIGTILGFEPPSMKLGELAVDDTIIFVEDEIFGAIKQD